MKLDTSAVEGLGLDVPAELLRKIPKNAEAAEVWVEVDATKACHVCDASLGGNHVVCPMCGHRLGFRRIWTAHMRRGADEGWVRHIEDVPGEAHGRLNAIVKE